MGKLTSIEPIKADASDDETVDLFCAAKIKKFVMAYIDPLINTPAKGLGIGRFKNGKTMQNRSPQETEK